MARSSVVPSASRVRPRLVGIVNITADSFSDGGRFLAADDALAHARRLRLDGADVIELGAVASNPDAEQVPVEEEQRRLGGVLQSLIAENVPVSVDSYASPTQRFAAACGAAYLNDIQGFPDPRRYEELAATSCRLIVMHSVRRIGPATKILTDPETVWAGIERFFAERLAALSAAGIAREQLIIDPGLGYFLGRTPEPSLLVLSRLRRLKDRFGVPVMVSPSRKSFLRELTGRDLDRIGSATLAAELYAARQGVDFIRTHDVAALSDALAVLAALESAHDLP
ncbi:dihydropteroate synthase [Nonomuraea sp. B10E15]|uniref:dihydropteroate synthase n=1 Tax=Nonomuraea sp. B10E15 TaxID=3153560 RepID=UPI00325E7707